MRLFRRDAIGGLLIVGIGCRRSIVEGVGQIVPAFERTETVTFSGGAATARSAFTSISTRLRIDRGALNGRVEAILCGVNLGFLVVEGVGMLDQIGDIIRIGREKRRRMNEI